MALHQMVPVVWQKIYGDDLCRAFSPSFEQNVARLDFYSTLFTLEHRELELSAGKLPETRAKSENALSD